MPAGALVVDHRQHPEKPSTDGGSNDGALAGKNGPARRAYPTGDWFGSAVPASPRGAGRDGLGCALHCRWASLRPADVRRRLDLFLLGGGGGWLAHPLAQHFLPFVRAAVLPPTRRGLRQADRRCPRRYRHLWFFVLRCPAVRPC